jgi:hypothetical protein
MDIGKAFTYVFDDENWIKKILIGGIVTIIPVVNLIAAGYGLRALRNVARGEEKPLPEWDDWGGDFVRGLMIAIAGVIYALPVILLSGVGAIIGAISSDQYGNLSGVGATCFFGVQCLSVLWGIAMALWMPAATIQYATTDEFGAFFRFGEIWALISGNLGAYGMAILTMIIASLVSGLGTILCIVGVIFTSFYGTLVGMHAYGQVAAEAHPPTTLDAFLPGQKDEPAF